MNSRKLNRLKLILLVVVTVVGLALVVDVCRAPGHQLTARSYIGLVHVYQVVGRPLLKGKIACRYRPTCSDYSIEAVQQHGTLRGLVLTYKRIRSCTNDVPMGTSDPVPK
jgi:putative membrane protein insertion efficiency factor